MNDEFKKFQEYLSSLSLKERQVISEQVMGRLLYVSHWASEVMIAEPSCCQRTGICASCNLRKGLQLLKDRMEVHG